jgi:translation initiation factor 3 subunit M
LAFANAHKALFTQYALDMNDLEYKMKLLTLATLASQLTSAERVLTFQQITDALQIPTDEVEIWVIDAIGNHLLDASIDQLAGIVTVR